jgi:hypothetical protein
VCVRNVFYWRNGVRLRCFCKVTRYTVNLKLNNQNNRYYCAERPHAVCNQTPRSIGSPPSIWNRIYKRLQMCINLSTIVTGHGKLRSNFHRFKIIDDPTCLCKKSPQTADHLLSECELLRKQRQALRNSIMKVGGNWPITNCDLAIKYTKFFFQKFVNTINFKIL